MSRTQYILAGLVVLVCVISATAVSRLWRAQIGDDCQVYVSDCSECSSNFTCIQSTDAPSICRKSAGMACGATGERVCDGVGNCLENNACAPNAEECSALDFQPAGKPCGGAAVSCCSAGITGQVVRGCMAGLNCVNNVCTAPADPCIGLPECSTLTLQSENAACSSTQTACCSAGVPSSVAPNCRADLSCVNGVCKKVAVCGNGTREGAEACDGGANCCTNAVSGCLGACTCPSNLIPDGAGGCKCPADYPYMELPDNIVGHRSCVACPSTPPPTPDDWPLIAGDCNSQSGGAEISTCCPQGYACKAYGSTSQWKCMRLLEDCEAGYSCNSYTDCASNYDSNGQLLDQGDPDFVHCYDGKCGACGNGSKPAGGGGGQTGTFSGGQGGGISDNTGGAAGADGGTDSGDGGNNGGSNSSNSSGQSSSSSSKTCNDTNPCIAATVVSGTIFYVVPASCPLEGSKNACYTQCIDTINRTKQKIDCNAQCGVDDGDLKMCPCNPDNQQCMLECMTAFSSCVTGCANNQLCKSQCSTQYRSCLDGCGRACPASSSGSNGSNNSNRSNSVNSSSRTSDSSRSGASSSRSDSSTSNGSNGSNNSNGSNSSQGSQNSSGSNRSGSSSSGSSRSNSSQGSNTSGSTSSTSSHSSSNQFSSASSLTSGVCCEEGNCNPFGTCSNPFESYKICKATCGTSSSSNRSNISQSSSTSSLKDGICCEAGNCNPFGKCSNPFVNYAACKVVCGASSMPSRISSSLSNSSSSRSSLSSFFSSSTSSSRSSSSSSSSSSSQSSSQSSASSRSQYSDASSQLSYGLPCTNASQCASGACINGICIDITSSRIAVAPRPRSSVSKIACLIDGDCSTGTRCILGRCLTVTDIASLPDFCGNARIDPAEICDNGALNSNQPNAYCRPDCTPGRCGDGIIDTPLERCDDGNSFNNDGCPSSCTLERTAPTATLPATAIELPFSNTTTKGNLGSNADGQTSDIQSPSSINMQRPTQNGKLPSVPSTPDTGPAALAVMIAGGAAGWLYGRRK